MTSTPFDDLDDYIRLPRIEALAVTGDGRRAVMTVAALNDDRTAYERSLWEVDAAGGGASRRLTRSAKGESQPSVTADGDVLFVSARPGAGDDDTAQLWMLPAGGGEARPVTALAGGVSSIVAVATHAPVVVIAADLLPSSTGVEDDARRRSARTKAKVSAILHDTYPVRFWDHDLGPAEPHLLAVDLSELAEKPLDAAEGAASEDDVEGAYPTWLPAPRDLTPAPRRTADIAGAALTPDGRTLVAAMRVPEGRDARHALVAIDVASGHARTIVDEPRVDATMPALSPDGDRLAWVRTPKRTPQGPSQEELWTGAVDGSDARRVAPDWDRWPVSLSFAADGASLVVVADDEGRAPIFQVLLDGSAPVALTTDIHAYSHVCVDRTSGAIVALRASWMTPAHPVRVEGGAVTPLTSPAAAPATTARMEEVRTTADDGTPVRGWLLLPPDGEASPAPLLLWIHGGPLASWNQWSWRWNPHLAVARGYAVLLPDPALSTGYGLDFIARGWNAWGAAPYTDLMAITDAVCARRDIDASRTAAMGGSFGGYMANWVAGHTDRFRAIVTHASLWSLDQFGPTTDFSPFWQQIFTPEGMRENSPHRFVDAIRTPLLVIHGDRDYRVPIGEGLRLWSELAEHAADEDGRLPHRFLYFPDENHWILGPQHAKLWYESVFAFLDEHVHGRQTAWPELLG